MTKFINPGLMKTSRRNVLRGSILAGAAAMTGTSAMAARRPQQPLKADAVSRNLHKAAADGASATTAKPADLSGYTRVKQELVAPPFAPGTRTGRHRRTQDHRDHHGHRRAPDGRR